MFTVRLISKKDAASYESLQRLCLTTQRDFIASEETFRWYEFMNRYPALGVFEDDHLVSVVRLEWHSDWKNLNLQLQSRLVIENIRFPVGYLCKAATHPEKMKLGLNGLLRYHAIKICQANRIKFLFGTVIKGSARVQSMLEMGYTSIQNPQHWQGYYRSDKTALICYLDLEQNGDAALEYLKKKHKDLIENSNCLFRHEQVQFFNASSVA